MDGALGVIAAILIALLVNVPIWIREIKARRSAVAEVGKIKAETTELLHKMAGEQLSRYESEIKALSDRLDEQQNKLNEQAKQFVEKINAQRVLFEGKIEKQAKTIALLREELADLKAENEILRDRFDQERQERQIA